MGDATSSLSRLYHTTVASQQSEGAPPTLPPVGGWEEYVDEATGKKEWRPTDPEELAAWQLEKDALTAPPPPPPGMGNGGAMQPPSGRPMQPPAGPMSQQPMTTPARVSPPSGVANRGKVMNPEEMAMAAMTPGVAPRSSARKKPVNRRIAGNSMNTAYKG